jgi:hypothetical protein
LQRMYPCLHTGLEGDDYYELGQKFFALLLDFDKAIVNMRKAASLPGSVQSTEPVLFNQEDLRQQRENESINKMGRGPVGKGFKGRVASGARCGPDSYLLPGGKGFKWRGKPFRSWKPMGKGGKPPWSQGGAKGGKASPGGTAPHSPASNANGASSNAGRGQSHRASPVQPSAPGTHSGPRNSASHGSTTVYNHRGPAGRVPGPSPPGQFFVCKNSSVGKFLGGYPPAMQTKNLSAMVEKMGTAHHLQSAQRGAEANLVNPPSFQKLGARIETWPRQKKYSRSTN